MKAEYINGSFHYGRHGGWNKKPKSVTVVFLGCGHRRSLKNSGKYTDGKTVFKVGSNLPRNPGKCPSCAKQCSAT